MSHAVFTIVTRVCRGHEKALYDQLKRVRCPHGGDGHIDFSSFPGLHFSSFTLFPPTPVDDHALLVFEHNVDGSWREHIDALVTSAERPLRLIYQHCERFPPDEKSESLRQYLCLRVKHPDLYHVGTPYRRVDTIQADLQLRSLVERRLDGYTPCEAGRPPAAIWHDVWEHVRQPDASGHRVAIPEPEPRWWTRVDHWNDAVRMFTIAVGIVTAGIWWLWPSPATLSASIVALFLALGVATGVLLGWPMRAPDRTPRTGESAADATRAIRSGWRTTINIWIWFAVVGWLVSLIPPLFRLAGFHQDHRFLGMFVLALITIGTLVFMVGQWSLPTPDLADPVRNVNVLARVKAQEDVRVINHMSAMVQLRPGRLRRVLLRALLHGLNQVWFRTWLPDRMKGRLFNFSTVHFAQWVVLENDRYLFLSNYDHSFSRYLDDFGNISFGLARLWGMGVGSPGLSSLERFKEFARSWMTPYSVWYAAYPDTSVTQVWNNEALRRGLAAAPASVDPQTLLQRLVNAKER